MFRYECMEMKIKSGVVTQGLNGRILIMTFAHSNTTLINLSFICFQSPPVVSLPSLFIFHYVLLPQGVSLYLLPVMS